MKAIIKMQEKQNPVKCCHCGFSIGPTDIGITFDVGDTIHVRCWRVNESHERHIESRARSRRSRKLVDESSAESTIRPTATK